MWTTLALMTMSLAPAQAGTPEFKNVRFTHGILGQTRKDEKFLPGEVVVLSFDIGNMSVKDDGRVLYAMGMEVFKKGQDKPVLKREPQDLEATNSLGGGNFPALAHWPIPRDSESPGDYTIRVTVTDRVTRKSATLTRAIKVVPTRLGFINAAFTTLRGDWAPPLAVPGQRMALRYTVVGFELDKKKMSDVTVAIRILDSDGKPTLPKPLQRNIKLDERSGGQMVMAPQFLEMNRPGKYKVELKATDNVAKKSTELLLDFTVLDIKNEGFTYGILGQKRTDTNFLPGDAVFLAFDVENMKVYANGRVQYSMALEVTKRGEKEPVRKAEPEDMEGVNTLGGGTLPVFPFWPIPASARAPGEYTIKTTITDLATKKPTTFSRNFTVIKPRLGFINVFFASLNLDATPPVAVPGQRLFLHYTLTGFEVDRKTGQSDLSVTIRILDSDGKPTLSKPIEGAVKVDFKKDDKKMPPGQIGMLPVSLALNRPGKYKVEIKVTDNLARKSAEQTMDFTVLSGK